MADGSPSARTLTHADFDDCFTVFTAAFMNDGLEHTRELFREAFQPELAHGVRDGDQLVGVASRFTPEMTLPGGTRCPVAAVTAVGVRPGHRRRGILTTLMRDQLDAVRERGVEPVAALHASEGSIYGRFGYAVGGNDVRLALPRAARFAPGILVDPRPVREVDRDEGLRFAERLYPSVAQQRTGWLSRDSTAWTTRIVNDAARDAPALRWAVHPDGYALYRPKVAWNDRGPTYELRVQELVATTPAATAALWRYLLDLDLVGEVVWHRAATDESVLHMLADPRQATVAHFDGVWLRLVDLGGALRARRYSVPVDVIVEVTDSFCPWNAGLWRLRAGADGVAECRESNGTPQVSLDVTDLAAAYLGGTTITALARAGRVTEHEPGVVGRLSQAFATDHAPHCPEGF